MQNFMNEHEGLPTWLKFFEAMQMEFDDSPRSSFRSCGIYLLKVIRARDLFIRRHVADYNEVFSCEVLGLIDFKVIEIQNLRAEKPGTPRMYGSVCYQAHGLTKNREGLRMTDPPLPTTPPWRWPSAELGDGEYSKRRGGCPENRTNREGHENSRTNPACRDDFLSARA